jgi:hypothetical protein
MLLSTPYNMHKQTAMRARRNKQLVDLDGRTDDGRVPRYLQAKNYSAGVLCQKLLGARPSQLVAWMLHAMVVAEPLRTEYIFHPKLSGHEGPRHCEEFYCLRDLWLSCELRAPFASRCRENWFAEGWAISLQE